MLLLTGFIYWQMVNYFSHQIDRNLLADVMALAADEGPHLPTRLSQTLAADPRNKRIGGLFDKDGHALAGNLNHLPMSNAAPGVIGALTEIEAHDVVLKKGNYRGAIIEFEDGQHLVFGRRVNELGEIDEIVSRNLGLAIIPLLFLAILGAVLVSRSTMLRVKAVELACRRIMAGHLEERLPISKSQNEFDILSLTVNRMIEEIQRLMGEVKGAGDSIAHDLRTPLTRLNARLDRILNEESDAVVLRSAIEHTIADVEQLLNMTRAVLRLGEIESGLRRSGFGEIDLAEVMQSVYDFYSAIAEEKSIGFNMECPRRFIVFGDGELLFEAIANLIDNAIKFTPAEGTIDLSLSSRSDLIIVRIDDDGPGISESERASVLKRFYRSDPARHSAGVGMGLALVSAIARLHGFTFTLTDVQGQTGCRAELIIPQGLNPGS